MRIAVRIGIVAFALLLLFAAYDAARNPAGSPAVIKAQRAVSHHLAQQAVDALGTGHDWAGVSIETAEPDAYALTIHYATRPDTAEQVAADTKSVVESVLYQLILASHHPSDEHITIVAQAQDEADGRPSILGSARYDFIHDKVVADPVAH